MPGPGIGIPTSGVPSGRANHYTTAPLYDIINTVIPECGLYSYKLS